MGASFKVIKPKVTIMTAADLQEDEGWEWGTHLMIRDSLGRGEDGDLWQEQSEHTFNMQSHLGCHRSL